MSTEKATLLSAVESGMLERLRHLGYSIIGSEESGRGSTVDLWNGEVRISVVADWLEGELDVRVQRLGEPELLLAEVVDLSQAKALHLARLPRGVKSAVVGAQLRQVAELLVAQAPAMISRA